MNKIVIFVLSILCGSVAMADNSLHYRNVDRFLRQVDLTPFIDSADIRGLVAQTKDANTSVRSVNRLDDFIVRSTENTLCFQEKNCWKDNSFYTFIAEFNWRGQQLKRSVFNDAWVGASNFTQSQIPALSLQEGLRKVEMCTAHQGDVMSGRISRLVIFKETSSAYMTYDYVFTNSMLPAGACVEALYVPDNNTCRLGNVVPCHIQVISQ